MWGELSRRGENHSYLVEGEMWISGWGGDADDSYLIGLVLLFCGENSWELWESWDLTTISYLVEGGMWENLPRGDVWFHIWGLGEQLTSVGPVRASLHSTADSFITILGSSQATAKYIEITIDCNKEEINKEESKKEEITLFITDNFASPELCH